jgi:uncharacterized protein with PQ loop repeat
MHSLVGSSLWLTYGLLEGDVAIWFSNVSFLIAQSIIISVVYRHGKIPRQVLIQVGVALAALALLLTQVSATPVGFVAIAVSGSSIVPQLIHVIRTENLHGISSTKRCGHLPWKPQIGPDMGSTCSDCSQPSGATWFIMSMS